MKTWQKAARGSCRRSLSKREGAASGGGFAFEEQSALFPQRLKERKN
jgi:hypothetical protein